MQNINQILDSVLLQINLQGTPEELKEAKQALREKLERVVFNVFLDNLTTEQKQEFLKILQEHKDPMQEIQLLAASVPGLFTLISDALEREIKLINAVFK
jgi:hypothetical protein